MLATAFSCNRSNFEKPLLHKTLDLFSLKVACLCLHPRNGWFKLKSAVPARTHVHWTCSGRVGERRVSRHSLTTFLVKDTQESDRVLHTSGLLSDIGTDVIAGECDLYDVNYISITFIKRDRFNAFFQHLIKKILNQISLTYAFLLTHHDVSSTFRINFRLESLSEMIISWQDVLSQDSWLDILVRHWFR